MQDRLLATIQETVDIDSFIDGLVNLNLNLKAVVHSILRERESTPVVKSHKFLTAVSLIWEQYAASHMTGPLLPGCRYLG